MDQSLSKALARRRTKRRLAKKGVHVRTGPKKKRRKPRRRRRRARRAAPARSHHAAPRPRRKRRTKRSKKPTGREHFIRQVMAKGQSRAQAAGLWKARHSKKRRRK